MGSPKGNGSVVPDTGISFALSLVATTRSLWTRTDLLNRNNERSCLKIKGNQSGRSRFNDLLRHPRSLLTYAG